MNTQGMEMTVREYEDRLALVRRELAEAVAERDKLRKFKQYVHARLDAAGVPVDPDGPHKAEGCRIGGRLDSVFNMIWALARKASEADVPAKPISRERVVHLLSPFSPVFNDAEIDELAEAANKDPDEGVDWLPYYKLALAIHASTMGFVCEFLYNSIKDVIAGVPVKSGKLAEVLQLVQAEFGASLMPCGVGPNADPGVFESVKNHAYQAVKADEMGKVVRDGHG